MRRRDLAALVPFAAIGAALAPPLAGRQGVARADTLWQPATARPLGLVANAAGYVPLDAAMDDNRLESLFGGEGGLPDVRGRWVEISFWSEALGRRDAYMAWLPPGYDGGADVYPTLYLLHGVGGPAGNGVEEWLGYALTEDLDRLLALNLIRPMIVVLPNGELGYWMNHAPGSDGIRWADFVSQDLVASVDATFRTDARRERRAVGGSSMGGHGALQLALNHPEVFAVAGAHGPALRAYGDAPAFFGDPAWFARYDPLSLVRTSSGAAAARRISTWIDVGHDDLEWRPAAEEMAQALETADAPLRFYPLEGEHEGWYWRTYLPEYLSYYSVALSATRRTAAGAPLVPDSSLLVAAADAGLL